MRDPTTLLLAAIALFAAMPGRAGYAYTLTLGREAHVRPGDVVNLPARLANTGTQRFTFGRDSATHVNGLLGPCCNTQPDPLRLTRIVVDSDRYATPRNQVGIAYSGYHGVPPFPGNSARIAYQSYSDHGFAASQLSPGADAIHLPDPAMTDPKCWMLVGLDTRRASADKTNFTVRAGRHPQGPDAPTHIAYYGAHTHTGAYQ